jgi:hypothetical protein
MLAESITSARAIVSSPASAISTSHNIQGYRKIQADEKVVNRSLPAMKRLFAIQIICKNPRTLSAAFAVYGTGYRRT